MRETSEAQPVFGQTHANRDRGWSARLGKSGEYGNGDRPLRLTLENGNGMVSTGRRTTTLILAVMAMPGLGRDGWRKRAYKAWFRRSRKRGPKGDANFLLPNATLLIFGMKNIILRIGLDTCDLSPGQTS